MSIPAVEDSWVRIEAWLLRHAPVSHALLRPPASPSAIRAAERALGVRFHSDLVASLSCHDGVELQPGAPVLAYYGPPSCVADIVKSTSFLRGISADVPDDDGLDEDDEADDEDDDGLTTYWHHDWLLITLGIGWQSSDGLFLSCHPGRNWGRLGHYFDEDIPTFTGWASLRHALADLADALERGRPFNGRTPLAYEGALLWEDETTAVPDPVSPLALAAESAEPDPEPPTPSEPLFVPVCSSDGVYLAMVRHRTLHRPRRPSPTSSSRSASPRPNCSAGWARSPTPSTRAHAPGPRRRRTRRGRRTVRWSARAAPDGPMRPRRVVPPSSPARRCCAGCPRTLARSP
ncbi:hypothetical protein HEP87_62625 [Streptomyces sp. S1D4-11]